MPTLFWCPVPSDIAIATSDEHTVSIRIAIYRTQAAKEADGSFPQGALRTVILRFAPGTPNAHMLEAARQECAKFLAHEAAQTSADSLAAVAAAYGGRTEDIP